jgi:hypothetical protein
MRDTVVVDALYRLAANTPMADSPVANARPSPSSRAQHPPAAAGQRPTVEPTAPEEGTVSYREPMFLLTDAYGQPRGAIAVEGGRWIGRDTAGRPLFDRKDQTGDIVALPRLLDPGWRFPAGRTPIAWVDLAGVVWLDTETAMLTGTDTGDVPPRLRQVLDDLTAGARHPEPGLPKRQRRPFNPAEWAVAVVDAHH